MSPDDERLLHVSRLWDEHLQATFPARLRGQDVAGVDAVMLDADVAGCITTWLGNRGRLNSDERDSLARCLIDLDRVVAALSDESERRYYERLRSLAALVLG